MEPKRAAAHWSKAGLSAGLLASASISVERWVTWEPYSPIFLPYDFAVLTFAAVLGFLVLGKLSRIVGEPLARVVAVLAGTAPMVFVWAGTVFAEVGQRKLFVLAAWLIIAAVLLPAIRRRRDSVFSLEAYFFAGSLAILLATSGFRVWPPLGGIFPVAILALSSSGVPRLPAERSRWRMGIAAIAATVASVCTFWVFPGSKQLVDTSMRLAPREGNSVILIVLDTLRQDHMSLYGYSRQTTPHLDRWAKDALVFENSTSNGTWTLPSHASIFTGLSPRSHGAHGFRGTNAGGNAHALGSEQVTLAELASGAGYETAAIGANHVYVSKQYGLAQGFDTFWVEYPQQGLHFAPSDWLIEKFSIWQRREFAWSYYRDRYITDNAVRWIRATDGRPFFLFLNYMDVHDPRARPPVPEVPLEEEDPVWLRNWNYWSVLLNDPPLTPEAKRYLINSYDRELIHLDGELRRLFKYIDDVGLAENTTIIVTSDHGEYFGEHGLIKHGLGG
jgi:hypothetical protein